MIKSIKFDQSSNQIFFSFLFLCFEIRKDEKYLKNLMIYKKRGIVNIGARKTTLNMWFDLSRIDTWEKSCRSADKAPGDIRQWTRNKRSVGGKEDREREERKGGMLWETRRYTVTYCQLATNAYSPMILLVELYLFNFITHAERKKREFY